MIKPDSWIKRMAIEKGMIEPFNEGQIVSGVVSYGLSSYGYDVRAANEFRIFSHESTEVADPKSLDEKSFTEFRGDSCIIPPNSYVLARSIEYFRMPRNVLGVCVGKSTYARCGIIVNITPLEPEWEGYLTIAVVNATRVPAKVYANEGIAQVVFFESDIAPDISYGGKKGKYQGQMEIMPPKV